MGGSSSQPQNAGATAQQGVRSSVQRHESSSSNEEECVSLALSGFRPTRIHSLIEGHSSCSFKFSESDASEMGGSSSQPQNAGATAQQGVQSSGTVQRHESSRRSEEERLSLALSGFDRTSIKLRRLLEGHSNCSFMLSESDTSEMGGSSSQPQWEDACASAQQGVQSSESDASEMGGSSSQPQDAGTSEWMRFFGQATCSAESDASEMGGSSSQPQDAGTSEWMRFFGQATCSAAEHPVLSSSSSEGEEREVFPQWHFGHPVKHFRSHQRKLRRIFNFTAPVDLLSQYPLQSTSSNQGEESDLFPHRHLRHHLKNLSWHRRRLRHRLCLADTDTGIFELLAQCTDYQLLQLMNFYRERLKPAIEDGVEELVFLLRMEGHFSVQERKQVIELTEKGCQTESSRLLLSLVIEKGAQARRATWEYFAEMRNELPKLDKILKEIQEFGPDPYEHMNITRPFWDLSTSLKDVQQKHKETLRSETETLRVNTILKREKVKVFQLVDHYAELTVISTLRDRRLVERELLAKGQEHERWRKRHLRGELEKIRTDQLFQSSFTRSKSQSGNSAVVAGVAGIGKTTMVQKIVYDWATGKIYQQFQFVFSFKFRDLNVIKCRITLKELILNQYPYFGNNLIEIWNNPEGLLFIFDGLNEFENSIDFANSQRFTQPQHQCPDPEWWCEVSDIVYSLIQGKLLPGCSVLVTTRPTALHLLEKAAISVRAEILGFVGEERKEYFIRHFENQAVAAAVFKHVQENEILYTMSYNPSYCWILALALGPFFTQRVRDPQRVPKTVTQLYSYYIYNILKNHGREIESPRDVFLSLGQMAFRGVSEKKVVFTDGDLISYNLQPSQFLSGFLTELLEREDSTWSVVYTFPHITFQEFVAALAQFLNPHPADILKSLNEAHGEEDGRFEVFLRFVVGLSSPMTTRGLQEFLGPFPHQTICLVIDWVKEVFERQIGNAGSETGKRSLLNTLHYLFECQNRGLAQAALGSVVTLSFSELRLMPIDCAVLSYIIGLCETIKHLDVWNCRIQCEGLQRLGPVLHKCLELRLGNNELGDSGVKLVSAALRNPECKIQKLGMDQVHLTDSGAEDLSSALSANRSLTELDLSYNKGLGDSGVRMVTAALGNPECKIQKLGLRDVGLTDSGIEDLIHHLFPNDSLVELELGCNSLTDQSVHSLRILTHNLPNLKQIGLLGNHFSEGAKHYLELLMHRRRMHRRISPFRSGYPFFIFDDDDPDFGPGGFHELWL